MAKLVILVSFQILEEKLFTVEHEVGYGFVIYGLYPVGVCHGIQQTQRRSATKQTFNMHQHISKWYFC